MVPPGRPYGRAVLAVSRSVPTPDAVARLVADAYRIAVTDCVLLRSLVNDVYLVHADSGRAVLKLYAADHRTPAEVAWEARLAEHLADAGAGVPRPRRTAAGDPVGTASAPEGDRAYLLWEYVPGVAPAPEAALYRRFGALVAGWHAAADRFAGPARYDRRGHDDTTRAVLAALADRPADRALVASLGSAAGTALRRYGPALDHGICHGDVTLDNLLAGPDSLYLHDLDLAGHRPRASDLTGVAGTRYFDDFAAGYRQVRPLRDADLAALPWCRVVALVANLHFHLVAKPRLCGTDSVREGWADRALAELRRLAAELR